MSLQHHEHDAILREFQRKLKDCTRKEACAAKENCEQGGACGRPYVKFAKLNEWLQSATKSNPNVTRLDRLLEAAYRDQVALALPISRRQICQHERCCLRVFSILLKMDFGRIVHLLRRKEFFDNKLPIDLLALRNGFKQLKEENPHVLGSTNALDLADRFDEYQWAFCPVNFDHFQDGDYQKNHIIPIRSQQAINDKGLTASLWQIVVEEEFVGKELRDHVQHLKCPDPEDPTAWVSITHLGRSPFLATIFLLPLHECKH
jgi:hypothetical protein